MNCQTHLSEQISMPQLSAELFCQIIMGLQSDERMSARHEKRKEGRAGVRCSIDVVPRVCADGGNKSTHVKVRDISPSGIGFISHMRMEVGMALGSKLPRTDGQKVDLIMIVRHCTQVSKGLYHIGVSFDRSKVLPNLKPAEELVET